MKNLCVWLSLLCVVACTESSTDRAHEAFSEQRAQTAAHQAGEQNEREAYQANINAQLAAKEARDRESRAASRASGLKKFEQLKATDSWEKGYLKQCVAELSESVCMNAPTGTKERSAEQCKAQCAAAIHQALIDKADEALNTCVGGSGDATCNLELPASADPTGKGVADFMPTWQRTIAECSDACAKQRADNVATATDRKAAAAQGEGIVLAYKRCMVATDSTLQARKYRVYDSTLYDNLMQATDERCRASNRCDWLEKYSQEFDCAYSAR